MQPLGQHMIIEHRKKQGSYDISLIPNQEKKNQNFTVGGSVDEKKATCLNRTEACPTKVASRKLKKKITADALGQRFDSFIYF